ncbi:unnamed protein product [Pleuronectes platessa]|uniref:Uncharacterized protein n=1 Tax=Pleuronectes platessa TaxID=8262 RepID=A0A9N7UEM1_PLEPL|nr:unnamed protein product [Pleuronectes platessa]
MAESEEEVHVLVQRVVKDITNAFKRNPNIDEIGVIPCPEARYNRSPIVLVENKLGVESWCIKFLLPYVHNKLLLYRQRKHWLDRGALVDITCTLLLLNPDFTTAWNVREVDANADDLFLHNNVRCLSKGRRSSMDGSAILVMCWADFTSLCKALRFRAVQLPYQAVMQPVRMLSMVHL